MTQLISVSLVLFSICSIVLSQYNMGALLTCFEQNDESPAGFKDAVWTDPTSSSSIDYPELHEAYMTQGPFPGKGDVCDHVDPFTQKTRDSCYFNTIFGEVENEEKTWSYKCWQFDRCPVLGDDGLPRIGCQVTDKRINCCCKGDFCNGGELIQQFAQWGRADMYPPNYDEICEYDFGDVYVKFTVPGYEHCTNDPLLTQSDDNDEITEDIEDLDDMESIEDAIDDMDGVDAVLPYTAHRGVSAHSAFMPQLAKDAAASTSQHNANSINVADILLIFTYFVIGIVCLGIGVFVGSKWQQNVAIRQAMAKQDVDEDDI